MNDYIYIFQKKVFTQQIEQFKKYTKDAREQLETMAD